MSSGIRELTLGVFFGLGLLCAAMAYLFNVMNLLTASIIPCIAGITLLVGFAAALGPLLSTRGGSPIDSLSAAGKGSSVDTAGRMGRVLAVAEVAVAVTLLVGAGLTVRSLDRLQRADVGFIPDGILALQLEASAETVDEDDVRALARDLVAEANALGVVDEAYLWSPMVPGQSS